MSSSAMVVRIARCAGLPACRALLALAMLMPVAIPASGAADAEALQRLRSEAQALEHGEGVARDMNRALTLYCLAAREGDAQAQFSLGWIYANGRGVSRDDALAAYFFSLAARQGVEQAANMLRMVGEPDGRTPACMAPPAQPPSRVLPLDVGLGQFVARTPEQKQVLALLQRLAPEYGISPRLALAVIRAESNFDPQAVSDRNAQGLMQLIPDTASRFSVQKPFDLEQNLRGGLAYLRWLLAYFEGNVTLVAAAYNAGEKVVDRYRGVPPYPETRDYVKRIKGQFGHDEHAFDAGVTEPSPELSRMQLPAR